MLKNLMLKNPILANLASADNDMRVEYGSDSQYIYSDRVNPDVIKYILGDLSKLRTYLKNVKLEWKKVGNSGFHFYYAILNVEIICDKIETKIKDLHNKPPKSKTSIRNPFNILPEIDIILENTKLSEANRLDIGSKRDTILENLINNITKLRTKAKYYGLQKSLEEGRKSISKDFVKNDLEPLVKKLNIMFLNEK